MKASTLLALLAVAAHADIADLCETAELNGGLIVHIGCGNGEETAKLHIKANHIVQGLSTSPEEVTQANRHFDEKGILGPVSARLFDGKNLPYIDNLVNLLIDETPEGGVVPEEALRVLAPRGILLTRHEVPGSHPADSPKGWHLLAKPVPPEIDEWTHHLYDAGNNPVSHDRRVGPPLSMQWEAEPKWARSHENMSSVSAMVSANGRIFSIIDQGPNYSIFLPAKWTLTARDAFNGIALWTRPIKKWQSHFYGMKSGPLQITRRMVAVGDAVYVTLALDGPVQALDAKTGKTLRVYEGTENTQEILFSGGTLYLLTSDASGTSPMQEEKDAKLPPHAKSFDWSGERILNLTGERNILAVSAETGERLWKRTFPEVTPMSMTADEGRIFCFGSKKAHALDGATGEISWNREFPETYTINGISNPMLFSHRGKLYVALNTSGGKGKKEKKSKTAPRTDRRTTNTGHLHVLDHKDGATRWHMPFPNRGWSAQLSILAANNLVWDIDVRPTSSASDFVTGYDADTGEKKKEISILDVPGIRDQHHRCYIPKATDTYLITSWPGVDYFDTSSGKIRLNAWLRGACIYGVMPANGLTYTPPHSCACYQYAQINGYRAVSAHQAPAATTSAPRLLKGPAYGKASGSARSASPEEWPTFRHDSGRSSHVPTTIPPTLKTLWSAKLGGRPTQPVVAHGMLFVASTEHHKLYAKSAKTGETLWTHTTSGRIDAPPLCLGNMVLFGSADGHVYNLLAETGKLVWRFRAEDHDRQMISFDRLEAVKRVHGNVLLVDGAICFVSGRTSYLDRGMKLFRLNPETGEVLSETPLYSRNKEGEQPVPTNMQMPGAKSDILSCDQNYIYMRHVAFDRKGNLVTATPNDHLFAPMGFLDDTLFHRAYWVYGNVYFSGAYANMTSGNLLPTGRIMAFNEERIYAYGRNYYPTMPGGKYRMFLQGERYYFCEFEKLDYEKKYGLFKDRFKAAWKEIDTVTENRKATGEITPAKYRKEGITWCNPASFRALGMVLTRDVLFAAGPMGDNILSQADYEGQGGILLAGFSTREEGKQVLEHKLDSMPVFDGMIAANGKMYLSMEDGSVLCLGEN